jgi:hypothetical protein
MKAITRIAVLCLILLVLATAPGQAGPLLYTFSGTVTEVGDQVGWAAAAGLHLGDAVTYAYRVDFSLPGNVNGTIWPDSPDLNNGFDYFWVQYVSGSAMPVPGSNGEPFYWELGRDLQTASGAMQGQLIGSNGHVYYSGVRMINDSILAKNWVVGTQILGSDWVQSADAGQAVVNSNLTLISIVPDTTTTEPVPEPTSMLLFGSGAAGLAGFVRRRRARQ